MNKKLLLACALLLPLSGCVTETTTIGDKNQRTADDIDLKTAAATRLKLGLSYLQKGNMSQAKMNLEKAEEFDPNSPDVMLGMVYYYQRVGNSKKAEEGYKEIISRYSDNADAMNNYGVFLCGQGRYQDAEKQFLQAVDVPKYTRQDDTYENAATCSYKAGNKTKAATYLDKALDYSPLSSNLLLEASSLALEMGNTSKASNYLQRYEQAGRVSAQGLWLKLQLADRNGELATVQKIGAELVKTYPTSEQAKRYLNNDY